MTKKLRNIIIIVIIIIFLILIALLIQMQRQKGHRNNVINDAESFLGAYDYESNKVELVKQRNDFFIVQNCIKSFYNNYLTYNKLGTNPEKVYNLLDNEYIQMFSISKDNLKGKFGKYESIKIDITDMYKVQVGIGKNVYFAYGYIIDSKSKKVTDLKIGVKVDSSNDTFSILPYEYLERKNYLNINESASIELSEIKSIENKEYNVYKNSYPSDETYVTALLENYINRALYNVELAYKTLDTQYREKKFSNVQEYKNFIKENEEKYLSYDMENTKKLEEFANIDQYLLYLKTFKQIELVSFKVEVYNEYKEYVCIDSQDNYYIFKETSPMQYTIMLDTYTIEQPKFTEEYTNANDQKKVMMNIDKFFDMINAKDYKAAYNCLADSFKNNYFKTQSSFEQYIKTNLYTYNAVTYRVYSDEVSGIHQYKLIVKNKENANISREFNIIMKLNSGTDFEMSFEV